MEPYNFSPTQPNQASSLSSHKRKRDDSQKEVEEGIDTFAAERIKTDVKPSLSICHYKVEVIEEKKTLSIQTFWGDFTIELGKMDQTPDIHIKQTFSSFWEKKLSRDCKKIRLFI